MDLKTKQDLEYYESEKRDKERMEEFYKNAYTVQPEEKDIPLTKEEYYESEKREKERMEEFYKNEYTFQHEEEKDKPLTKEELRIARLRYFEKKIDLNKPT